MKIKFIILLFLLLFIHSVHSECPVLCDTCPSGSSTCSACYPGFEDTLYSQWIPTGTCPCPAGYFMNTTTNLCLFCPITCQTCINSTTCTTCIAGYQIDNNKQCTKKYSNAGQWVTMDVGNDLTQQKLQKSVTTGFYLIDYVASMLVSNSIQNCTKLSPQLFFGMYSFDYNTQVIKSYFGLPHHDWVHIKFQFVAVNNWTNTKMILEINDRESYKLDLIEGVLYSTQKSYSFNIRHRDFCLSGTPDNLGFFNLYLSHQASMLKIRIRTDLMNTSSTSGTSFSDYVYFGLSNLFVRSGTCPTNCRRCSGPNVCLECISPYKTTATGTCDCNTTIGQLTQLGRCVPKCQTGYIFAKVQTMTESKCILCSLVSSNLRNCFACMFAYNSYQCLICQQGYILNSTTGLCSQYCPSNTFVKSTFDSTYGVNRLECIACGANCTKCSYGVCSTCANGTVYQQGNCILTCSQGFYLDSSTNQCLKCLQNCATCTSQFTCTRCTDNTSGNFIISGGQCIPKCVKYNNCSTTNCDVSCSQCYGPGSNQCTACSSVTDLLQNNTCLSTCSAGYFLMNTNQCAKCLSPCMTCVNYESCSSCQTGYFLFSQSCVRECPVNYYPDSSLVCQPCSANCKSCYNDTSCLLCANNYILFEGKCIIDTPCSMRVGFYYDEKTFQCLPCPQNCTSCYKDLCYHCSLATVLDNGKCIEQCSSQKVEQQQLYFDPVSQSNLTQRVCRWKDPLCNHYTLVNGSSTCDQCIFMNPMLVLLSPNNQCSFTCPLDMVKTQTNNIVSCQSCPDNCKQCLSNLTCIKCNTNYVLNPQVININTTAQCLSTCPQGYTSDGYQCFPCKVNCKSCDIMGRCYQCYSPYIMTSSNNCVTDASCLSNQYKNSSVCVNCSTGCATCLNSTVCTSCGVSSLGIQYYLKLSTCVIDCSSGYFKYQLGNQCRKCPSQCLTCVSVTQCSICIEGYFLLLHPIQRFPNTQIGTCVRECPLGYYNSNPLNTDKQIATCLFCSSNCLSCYGSSEDQCLSCYGTFKLANGRCVENCPAGKYQDTTGHCDWCHPSCLSCTGPAQFQCITCNPGYYLYRSQCYQNSCPGSTYPVDYDSRVCQLCQWGCQVCSSPYNCSVCTGGFYLYEGWCYLQCPLNTQPYLDLVNQGYRCGKCSSKWYNCVECVTSNCTRCAPSYFKLNNDCLTACPVGYYADLTPFPMCKNCPRNCLSCASETKCTQCLSGSILSNGQCTTTCPSTKYFNRLNATCSNCKQYCLNCVSDLQCQNCLNGYYLHKQYVNGTLTSYCLIDCGEYRYEDQQTNTCQNCSSNCRTCSAMNNCTKCLSGYTLMYGYCYPTNNTSPTCNISHCLKCLNTQLCETCQSPYFLLLTANLLTLTSSCVDKCPSGTYADGKNCKICNLTCTACSIGPDDCSQCVTGFYLFERRCWKQCPTGFYKNDTLSQCQKCPSDCYDCLNSTYCKSCQLQQKSYKGICYDSCPDGTYQQGQICIDCPSTCKKCDSLNLCKQCQTSYVLYENQCILDCPSGTFLSLADLTCKRCSYPCNFCKSQSQCTTCVEGFVFDSQISKCVSDCGDGRFAKNASINGYQCSACPENCNQCLNSTYCLTCTNGKFMYKGKCLPTCPMGTYSDTLTQRCRSCSPNCMACVVYEACIQCHNQTVLYNGKCLDFCPSGFYQVAEYSYQTRTSTNLCKPCLSPCNECNGSTVYNCKSCVSGFYLYESICVLQCPADTYAAAIESFSTPSQLVNLVRNGDFQHNKCQTQTCIYNSSNYYNEVDGWLPDSILEIGYGRLYSSYLTTQRVIQLGQRNSCVEQIIPALTSGDYQLQFSYAARKNRQFSDCQFKVTFNGIEVSYIYPSDYLVHTETVNVSLSANSTNVELEFCAYAGSNSNYGSVIKGVNLVKKTTEMNTFSTTIVNSLQAKCVKCPVGCLTCTNKTYCTQCATNWTLATNNVCKPNTQCALQNCQICEFTNNSSVCRKCVEPFNLIRNSLLQGGTSTSTTNTTFSCVLSCPVNTFQADDFTCLSCPTNCLSCKYTECTACKSGFYLFKTSCVETCPTGFIINTTLGTCQPSTCLYRNSNGDCIQCLSPYLLQRGTCVTVCGQRTYQEDNTCVDCDSIQSKCYNCTSLATCTSCITGYFYSNGHCINKCPSNQYLVINTPLLPSQSCQPCTNSLQGCLYCTNSTTCTQCIFPQLLAQGTCVMSCPYGFYKSGFRQQCVQCSVMITNCLSCFNQTTCLVCGNGTYLVNGKCTGQCSNGYFLNTVSNTCQLCDSKCFTCTSLGNCTSCRQNYFLLASTMNNITTYSCTQTCPIGFYPSINSTCIPCSSQCLTCTFEKCLSCPSGKYLMQGKCLSTCPDRYFTINGQCKMCSSSCKTCVDSESKCTNCYDGFVYNSTTSSCITNCTLVNQFYDPLTYTCSNCSISCQSCYGPRYDQCLTCNNPLSLINGVCIGQCPVGYYRDSNSICKQCDLSKCLTCQGSAANCTSCGYPNVLIVNTLTLIGRCDINCGLGYYYDSLNKLCVPCSSGCQSCIDSLTCISCENGKYLYQEQCITTCPSGLIPSTVDNTCRKCPLNCNQCTLDNTSQFISCTQCISPLFLINGTCYSTCPSNTYLSNISNQCTPCENNCLTCKDATTCITCVYPYVFYLNQCLAICPIGFVNINNICVPAQFCTQYVYNGSCYSQCPVSTYLVANTTTCKDCAAGCLQCISSDMCTSCITGFYLYINPSSQAVTCVQQCPLTTYVNGKYCVDCPTPCNQCIVQNNNVQCTSCLTGYFYNGNCLSSCPSGYYMQPSTLSCQKCSPLCLTCDNNANCLTCSNSLYSPPNCNTSNIVCLANQYVEPSNSSCVNCNPACAACYGPSAAQCTSCANFTGVVYYLLGSSCLTDCPVGYVKNATINKCTQCSVTNCLNCSQSSTTCTSCYSGYILFTNSTTTKCILNCNQLNIPSITNYIYSTNTSTCTSCSSQVPNCLQCYYSTLASKTVCTTCASPYFLYPNNTCLANCPSAGFYSSQNKYCLPCSLYCTTCTNDSTCTVCNTNYYLYQNQCLSACPVGYYSTSTNVCTICQTNCKLCNSTQCTDCNKPYALDLMNHCTQCGNGYFMNSLTSTCQICATNCLQCTTSSTQCTKCATPLFLFNNMCLATCPSGYYGNTLASPQSCSTCESLVTNCANCLVSGCTKCKDTFYLYSAPNTVTYSCVSQCPAGYYADNVNMICLKCMLPNCAQCSSSSQCTVCTSPYKLLSGSCVQQCPLGYAPATVSSSLSCVPCKTGCKDCSTGVDICTVCNDNFHNNNDGSCSSVPNTCRNGEYLNALGTCSPCHYTCLTCYGGFRTNCLACWSPQYTYQADGSCQARCPIGTYYDSGTIQCQSCSTKYGSNCLTCDSSQCFSCQTGTLLSSDGQSCPTTCPASTYLYNNQCLNCPQHCLTCTSSTTCTQCANSTYIFYNNLCYSSCPLMTQPFNNTCRSCDSKCLVCVGTTTNCTSCKSTYRLYSNTCVDVCPLGTYEGTVSGVNNVVCLECMSPCSACSVTATNCTMCPSNYYLWNYQCVASCPAQTYPNSTTKTCQKCQYPCLNCIASPTNCTNCQSGFVYSSASNTCSSQCANGTYLAVDPATNVTSCTPCSLANCKTCDATQCYKCSTGYYATLSASGVVTSCTTTCPDYYFIQSSTSTCQKCKSLCLTCTTLSDCQKCVIPYFLYNNECITTCPQQTYSVLNAGGYQCKNCSTSCSVCVDNLTCTTCVSGTFLMNGKCYTTCPSGYYGRSVDNSCQPCPLSNCQNCTALQCLKCALPYYGLTSNTTNKITSCVSSCPDYYFANPISQLCQKCLPNCQRCTNNTTCQQCQSPKVLFINGSVYSCLDQCPLTYFYDHTSSTCQPCQPNCNQCNSSTTCFNCTDNFVVFYNSTSETTCVNECPQYYYKTLTSQGYAYCEACSANCLQCTGSNQCTVCQSTHTLVNYICVPHNCVDCDLCDRSVDPPVCLNCTLPFLLYKIKCFDNCPIYYFPFMNITNTVLYCQKCIDNCLNCTSKQSCNLCIPDYVYIQGQGCVNEAVYQYGAAANMSGFTSNITQTMAKVYLGTSVGPVAFGEMSTTYFNVEFTQMMLFHPSGGNSQMTQFLNSLQTMSLTSGGTTVTDNSAPQQVQARRRLLTTATYYTQSFIQVNASIFFLMFAFLGAYLAIYVFQRFITQTCRVSCNLAWFYLDAICQFMQKRFKWIYFDFIMWLSYIPFLYFAVLQLKQFTFENASKGFSSILAIVIICTYPLYPVFICHLLKSHYSEISLQPGEEVRQTLTEMSLSPYLTKVKRPVKNIVVPWEEQVFSCRKYFNKANFILIYYPLKYVRKFLFVMVAAIVSDPIYMVAILIAINILFIMYIIALRPRTMPYLIFDLIIEFVLLAFEGFLLVYLILDGPKIAMMSIITHAVGFVTANLSLITAIVLNLIAYYKIFLCIKDLISHLRQKAAERTQSYNKFEVEKQFLDPNSDLYIEKQIGKLRRLNDNDDTDQDDEQLRLSSNGRKLLENLGQKDLLLNGIDPVQYVKNLSKQQNYGIEEKELALKYVNTDDITDSDDSSIDQNTMDLARKLEMNEKTLALNKIHPVKFAKQLTKDDAPLEMQYKKFDEKHVDRKLARQINDDGQTDSDDDSIDDDAMNIAKRLQLNEKQLAFNEINPVKFMKEDTKKDAPLQDRYKKFDEKNVDKKLARIINEDNATDSDDSEIDEQAHDLTRKLQLNEKQLAFNQINPVKFFKEQTKKEAPLQEQYQKFDEKHIDKMLASRINDENKTDSEDDESSVDEDAHNLARKLNLNEKQLAFNEINPMKFFKQQTKMDAPLQQVYKKFDEKNVDRKLVRVINDDGDTDSQNDDDSEEENDGYRLARELKLNEKQLAANNLNPVKVMQQQAKKNEKLKNIIRQFDEKQMDMKVARMINDNGETESEQDDQDEQQVDKIIVARQLKLDEKQLAVNNINPMKYVKETTKIDPNTNEPKINQATLSTAIEASNMPNNKPRRKLLDKELRLRNQMKKQLSQNQYTDQDEQDITLSRFNKERLKNMTEKQMMMEGLDPIKAVKKITKQAIAKKMAKKNTRNYDDQIPDFKVSPKKSSNPITNAIRSTQQKLKESTKGILGNKKDNLKGSHKLPSEQRFTQANNQNLIDSDSDQENKKLNAGKKMLKSQNVQNLQTKIQTIKTGRKQIQEVWDDQFEILKDKKEQSHLNKSNRKHQRQMKKPKISLADPNNKIKNFDQQFSDSFMSSEQNSEAALNLGKFNNQQDIQGIQLSHKKPTNVNLEGNSRKVIDLGMQNEQKFSPLKRGGQNKRSESQMNMRPKVVVRQDEMFNQFEEFDDLGQIKQKQFNDKKYQRNLKSNGGSQRQRGENNEKPRKQFIDNDEFENDEISSVEDKQIEEPKYKRNSKKNTIDNGQIQNQLANQVTESYVFKDGQKVVSKNRLPPTNKNVESERYTDLANKNKISLKIPKSYDPQTFEEADFAPRPVRKMSRQKSKSKVNSDNESQSGDFANKIRKERISANQRLRSGKLLEQNTQSNPASSKRSSVHKKIDRQSRLKMEKINNANEAENSDDLEHIQI